MLICYWCERQVPCVIADFSSILGSRWEMKGTQIRIKSQRVNRNVTNSCCEPIDYWNRLQTPAPKKNIFLNWEEEIQFCSSPPWSPNKSPWRNFTPCFGKLVQNNFEHFLVTVTEKKKEKKKFSVGDCCLFSIPNPVISKPGLRFSPKFSLELPVTWPPNSRVDSVFLPPPPPKKRREEITGIG